MIPNTHFLGFTQEELRPWIILGSSILVLALLVVILARLRRIQSRPLAACVVLSIVAHGLILFGLVLFRLFEFPESPGVASFSVHFDESAQVTWSPPEVDSEKVPVDDEASESEPIAPEPEEPANDEPSPGGPNIQSENKADDTADIADMSEPPSPPEDAPDEPPTEAGLPDENLHPDSAAEADNESPQQEESPFVAAEDPERPVPEHPAFESSEPIDDPQAAPAPEGPWQPTATIPPGASLRDMSQAMTPQTSLSSAADAEHSLKLKAFEHRGREYRAQIAAQYGGNEDTEAAVRAALQWLSRHQAANGGWNASQYGAGRGGVIDGQERGLCGIRADTGVTSLALLAFLASGSTPQSGDFSSEVSRALRYLVHSQDSTGSLAGSADHFAAMYCHGIATLALSEAYSMSADEQLVVPLQRALNYTVAAQHPETGGWRYRPGDDGDTSQFGWQALALHSGKSAGFGIPSATFSRMERFLNRVSQGHYGGLAAYRPDRQATPTMTAEALVCRLTLGKVQPSGLKEGIAYLLANPPGRGPSNFYYNYYGALALHLSGENWDSWNRDMQRELLSLQVRDGEMTGSWNADSVWGHCGGRVFSTATAALCMEVYYRYLPIINRNLAKQPR
jgi:hypothetical protein